MTAILITRHGKPVAYSPDPVFGPAEPMAPQPCLLGVTVSTCKRCQVRGTGDRCWYCGQPWS